MRFRFALAVALVGSLAGCNSLLDESPADAVPDDQAIIDAEGARTALIGAYNALQLEAYYDRDMVIFGDLLTDNVEHVGTLTAFSQADANQLRADNSSVAEIWNAIYDGINRVNQILLKVPALTDLEETEKNEILGEAHFLRALHYHNLVKLWGGVPIRLTPITTVEEASEAVRATAAEVYEQIASDLNEAGTLITSTEPATQATVGAVHALKARVALYQADYATALAEADAVVDEGYALAPAYSDLFDPDGIETTEDIFKVIFTPAQFNLEGFYYTSEDFDGRGEVAPTQELFDSYEPGDTRQAWSITLTEDGALSGSKWPTTIGGEDIHAIRFAEVLLIKAGAQARQNDLAGAVATYNLIRVRAGLAPHVLGADVSTQAEVLAAIDHERRLELAMEGDRWPDLVRTGTATTVLGIPEFQTLWPIPQSERAVAPGLTQNPGY
jgi:starch-binding outer membrane protein, SusD/RagB family